MRFLRAGLRQISLCCSLAALVRVRFGTTGHRDPLVALWLS
ncbi:hypothetical protein RHOER0001_1522 [Rhodococcus erythropolis SK121]|nr:hypothetical protein RHOER0001_1522 [Rhodococcus erythropolis SK121]